MILRPVSPASAIGPPISNRPLGLIQNLVLVIDQLGRDDLADDELLDILLDLLVGRFRQVLGRDDHRVNPHRLAVRVLNGHLALAIRQQVPDLARLAGLGEAASDLVRQRDRQRHQFLGLVAGVADHHALVAGAGFVEDIAAASAAVLQRVRHPGGDFAGSAP